MWLMELMTKPPFCKCNFQRHETSPLWIRVFYIDTTTRRFFYAKQCDVSVAHRQFKEASLAREVNQLCSFYESIDVHAYEETRNLVSSLAYS